MAHFNVFLIHFLEFEKINKFLRKKKQVLVQLFSFEMKLHDFLLSEVLPLHLQKYSSILIIVAHIIHYEIQLRDLAKEELESCQ